MRKTLLVLATVVAAHHGFAQAQAVTLLDTARIASPRLLESSGVVASARPGVFWTHNDSGDEPFLYAIDSAGRDLGRLRVRGAGAVDWEDIDAGPCVVTRGRCLYIGDIGDNRERRDRVVLYRVLEPEAPADPGDTLRSVEILDSLVVRYPGGPRDAESVVVMPDGWLLLVSKPREGRPRHYWASLDATGSVTLTDRGPLPIAVSIPRGRLVTGGTVSPDGRWVVLRTYVSLHFFRRTDPTTLQATGRPEGIPIPYVEPQGEGIAFDGPDRLLLASERGRGAHGVITRLLVRLPDP
jgi:hypothetical protein